MAKHLIQIKKDIWTGWIAWCETCGVCAGDEKRVKEWYDEKAKDGLHRTQ